MSSASTLVVTGASGQLGRLVIKDLVQRGAAKRVIGLIRNEKAADALLAEGIRTRIADYGNEAALADALAGADRVLLISSSEVGQRLPQHRNVIKAAKAAGVKRVAYTSILRADSNPMLLAIEHKETEQVLRASGLPFAFLRNGWYTENYTQALGLAVQHGAILGAAGEGKLSTASRADYAAAAATVLLQEDYPAQAIHELAGDSAFTMAQLAAEVSRHAGKTVAYNSLPADAYKAALVSFGLPEGLAAALADSDAKAAHGALHDDSGTLSRLIGKPTTPMAETVADALKRL